MQRLKVAYIPNIDTRQSGIGLNWNRMIKHIGEYVDIVHDPEVADVVHVSSDYAPQERVDVYTCQGGFLPPLKSVFVNLEHARKIIFISNWLKGAMHQYADKASVIGNGVDPDEWEGVEISDERYVLVKGYSVQTAHLRLVSDVMRARQDLRFVTIGWDRTIPCPANSRIVNAPISFSELQRLIAGCSCYISPSLETFGTLTLEAWWCRKPVLGLKLGGNLELMYKADGSVRGGLLYLNGNGLASSLSDIHPAHGEEGWQYVNDNFLWKNLVSRVYDVYIM